MIAQITWTTTPGVSYIIRYKEAEATTWITPPGNPTNSSPFIINGITAGVLYDGRIETPCGMVSFQFQGTGPVEYIWVEGDYICQQTEPFSLQQTYSGFSSPGWLHYDAPLDRYYVADIDDINGNIYYIDPDAITGYGSRTVVGTTPTTTYIQNATFDPELRKMWLVGDNTGGAWSLDIPTGVVTTVPFGTDGAYFRNLVTIFDDIVYCNSKTSGGGVSTMVLIDKNTNTVISTLPNSSIDSGSTYFSQTFAIYLVNGEIWCCAGPRNNGNIAVYNSTLSNTPTIITLTGSLGWPTAFWQTQYFDEETDRFYVFDAGSNQYFVIDATSKTIITTKSILNRGGKTNGYYGWVRNPLTGDLYLSGESRNTPNDITPIPKTYKINRNTYEIDYIYPGQKFSSLIHRTGTNELWGVDSKLIYSQGGSWATDGLILKYIG